MNALLSLAMLVGFNNPCLDHSERREGIKIQTGTLSQNECFISVGETKWRGMVYRNFLFTSSGEIMVFNSLGNGPISTDTGARAFYLRPFRTELGWRFNEQNDLEVLTPSGAIARFDREAAEWVELTGGAVTVERDVNRNNNGGVELRYDEGFMVDSGFRFGGHPTSRMDRKSIVTNNQGVRCEVENKEVFYRVGDEHEWNYPDDVEFAAWFDRRCN